jgi:hypothetical protein
MKNTGKTPSWLGPAVRTLALGTVGAVFLLNYYADPSHAAFFTSAEQFLTNNINAGAGGAGGANAVGPVVKLVFNVLRGLFLLYVGLALITTVNALRQDEDWQSVARTPLLVALSVGVADVVTTLIVGGAGGAGGV